MSRIGKQPVPIPGGVKVDVSKDRIRVEGPKGKLEAPLFPGITAEVKDNMLILTRAGDDGGMPAFHGLARALSANAIQGVSTGFSKKLEIVGVGYRAKLDKKKLELNLGYSKPVVYTIPDDIEIEVAKPTQITISGIDKQRVGQEAHVIRGFRPPEPYKLKGIRYAGERLIKKERKAGVSGA